MVRKVMSVEEFVVDNADDLDDEKAVAASRGRYPQYYAREMEQSPLVMHANDKGGHFIYLGFVEISV